nr:Bifunctional enolase 2/transcriptional activator [Ipomoea trifida]
MSGEKVVLSGMGASLGDFDRIPIGKGMESLEIHPLHPLLLFSSIAITSSAKALHVDGVLSSSTPPSSPTMPKHTPPTMFREIQRTQLKAAAHARAHSRAKNATALARIAIAGGQASHPRLPLALCSAWSRTSSRTMISSGECILLPSKASSSALASKAASLFSLFLLASAVGDPCLSPTLMTSSSDDVILAVKETIRFLGIFAGTFVSVDEIISALGGHRRRTRKVLNYLTAIEKTGYTEKVVIGMDVAASEFYGKDKTYDLNFKEELVVKAWPLYCA